MTSLRVALKLSMAEVKPDSGRGKKKSSSSSSTTMFNNEEDSLPGAVMNCPDMTEAIIYFVSGRKRKLPSADKEHKNKSISRDKTQFKKLTDESNVDDFSGSEDESDKKEDKSEVSSIVSDVGGDTHDNESVSLPPSEHAELDKLHEIDEVEVESDEKTMEVDVGNESNLIEDTVAECDSSIVDVAETPGNTDSTTVMANTEKTEAAAKKRKKRSPAVLLALELAERDNQGALVENDGVLESGGRTNRAAALVAKTKLNSKIARTPSTAEDDVAGTTADAGLAAVEETSATAAVVDSRGTEQQGTDEVNWVMCDNCSKWRSIARHIEQASLPEKWFCRMNTWDTRFNNCNAPDEVVVAGRQSRGGRHSNNDEQLPRSGRGSRGGGRWRQARIARDSLLVDEEGVAAAAELSDNSDEEERGARGRSNREGGSSRRKSGLGSKGASGPAPAVAAVNWVQCNKCKKWRKVPEHISMDVLPDKWFCSLNTWALAFARCSAKEEQDDTAMSAVEGAASMSVELSGGFSKPVRDTPSRKRVPTTTAGVLSSAGGPGAIKKVSWVQCERRNCKKWRKVPATIDTEQFPEKWFCEMNTWDGDVASCDAPEVSDSEDEHQQNADTRSQLILANSKGPGTLSYRRIIFGTDGKIRSCFSEKNRNGYGIFSFSETQKQSGGEHDEYQEPTRSISYWWSGAYDESGVAYVPSKSARKKETAKDVAPEAVPTEFPTFFREATPPSILLDAARRMAALPAPLCPSLTFWPKKTCPLWTRLCRMTVFQRDAAECGAVRSCFLASPTRSVTLPALQQLMTSCRFLNRDVEACRVHMSHESLKGTLRRLEERGLLGVNITTSGLLSFELLRANDASEHTSAQQQLWVTDKVLPLKLRKFYTQNGNCNNVGTFPSALSTLSDRADSSRTKPKHHDKRVNYGGSVTR